MRNLSDMPKKIGVFGGAFNPLHLGHLDIANKSASVFDQVSIVPCVFSRYGKDMLPFEDRMEIARITVRNNRQSDNIFVDSTEKLNPDIMGRSFELIKRIKYIYDTDDATLIIGNDSLGHIKNWYGWGNGLEKENFLVFNRENRDFPEFEDMKNFKFMDIDPLYKNASSTGVRSDFNHLSAGECLFMDLEAAKLCKANNFYLAK